MPLNGEVKVIITDSRGNSSIEDGYPSQPTNPYNQTTNLKKKNAAVNTSSSDVSRASLTEIGAVTYLVSTAKQAGSMALANVGRYTGSVQTQIQVNNVMQTIGLGVALYSHPIAALTSIAFSATQTIMDENFRQKQENMQLSISRARAGYTDTKSILTSRRH